MDAFEEIVDLYSRIRAENAEPRERPPATSFSVKLAFEGIGLNLPMLLEKIYTWHNGIFHLNAFLHFPSLRESVNTYRTLADLRLRGSEPETKASWFPILDLNGDILYCLDVDNGEIWAVDIECGTTWLLARSYERYIDALRAAFDRESAVYDPHSGEFDISDGDWAALCREFGLESI
jgi:hypothetical protein